MTQFAAYLRALLLILCVTAGLQAAPLAAQSLLPSEPDPQAEAEAEPESSAPEDEPVTATPTGLIAPPVPNTMATSATGGPDYSAWRRTAARSERISETGQGSDFALERLRADLVIWRDRFLAEQNVNAARISTVQAQLDALGPPPEGDALEEPQIAGRRAELEATLTRLRAPVLLAQEAWTHANGLIGEIDTLIRDSQARRMLTRSASPLNPTIWPQAMMMLTDRSSAIVDEVRAAVRNEARRHEFLRSLPSVILFGVIGLVLLARGRHWAKVLQGRLDLRSTRGQGLWIFLVSLAQIALPLVGLWAISQSLIATGLLGFRSLQLVAVLPQVGVLIYFARWLGEMFFPADPAARKPLDLPERETRTARRTVAQLGWMLGFGAFLRAFLTTGEPDPAAMTVLNLSYELLVAILLFRLGRIFTRQILPQSDAEHDAVDDVTYRQHILVLVGRVTMAIALAGPILSLLGFVAASEALIFPAIVTLALMGLVILLQGLVFDIYTIVTRSDGDGHEALIPLLIGFMLVLLSIPALVLIWGGRIEDLTELWTRFREGLTFGETRISPTDFITFAIVFFIGYTLTRLLKGIMRSTVLPKTKMDIGGQNAVVAGLGYLGIFLAAIIAITSAGIDLSSLAIVAGALSVGIGFGLQNIVSNFVSGIILLIERPVSEGDWIEVGGQMGYVRDISVRSTRIETFDRTDVIVPNADLISGQVTNWTRGNSVGRIIVPVGVAYGTDTTRVAAILREIAEAHPMVVLTPPPAVLFAGFGADSLDFEIRAILRDVNFSLGTKSEMNHQIARRFAEEGIEIPFAQRDIWLRNPEALRPAAAVPSGPIPDDTRHPDLEMPAAVEADAADADGAEGEPT